MAKLTHPLAAVRLLRRDPAVVERFVHYYDWLRQLSWPWRRSLRRRLALTVAGAALLLALDPTILDLTGWRTGVRVQPVRSYATSDITVANGAVYIVPEDGVCSLVEAIDNANDTGDGATHDDCAPGNPAGADTIILPPDGQFTLSAPVVQVDSNWLGLPPITSEITLTGNGTTIRRDPAAPSFNILSIYPPGRLMVKQTTFEHGESQSSSGGAISAHGDLIVEDSAFRQNSGSAIHSSGQNLTIHRSEFTGNSGGNGEAITIFSANLTLSDSLISGNTADYQGSSVFIFNGTATITNTVFHDNYSFHGDGAALHLKGASDVSIDGCRFIDNTVEIGMGGAIFADESQFAIHDSIIAGNSAHEGGGLYLRKSEVNLQRTTINDNRARWGGGIRATEGLLQLNTSTLSGNAAITDDQGGPSQQYGGFGGGLLAHMTHVTLNNATIVGNQADKEGGGLLLYDSVPNNFLSERSLITGNAALLGPQIHTRDDSFVVVDGFNLFGADGDAGIVGFTPGPSDIVPPAGVTVAQIIDSALAQSFGPTPTHALPLGSPAIDAAPSGQCDGQTDQRGFARNINGDGEPSANECDIGAYERGPIVDNWAFLPIARR